MNKQNVVCSALHLRQSDDEGAQYYVVWTWIVLISFFYKDNKVMNRFCEEVLGV